MGGAQQQAFGEVWSDNLRRDREPVGETRRKCHRQVARDIEGQRVASRRATKVGSPRVSLINAIRHKPNIPSHTTIQVRKKSESGGSGKSVLESDNTSDYL